MPSLEVYLNEVKSAVLGYVEEVEDPRVPRTQKHKLTDILIIAILAVIAGGEEREDGSPQKVAIQ
jgi:hypothetical protein